MRKLGNANLEKAKGFHQQQNWLQALRYAEIAATKLKQLKDRRLETVQANSDALTCKFDALGMMARYKDAMECIKECYTLWAMNHLRNSGSIKAALQLIQSCLHNGEYEDAEHYARHAMFMINEMTDNFIPVEEQPSFLAHASYFLAVAIFNLAKAGGIPPAEKQKAGEEAIALAREALELHTQLFGSESAQISNDMDILAQALDFFNNVDDDEILRLYEQAIAILRRVEGGSSPNVAASEGNFGSAYSNRASRAQDANDLDRCLANMELSLPHVREAARIYRAINHMEGADRHLRAATLIEENIRKLRTAKAAAGATTRGWRFV